MGVAPPARRALTGAVVAAVSLAGCAARATVTVRHAVTTFDVPRVAVEITNASGRELPAPRPSAVEEIGRIVGRRVRSYSALDALSAAVAAALREHGVVATTDGRPPVLRLAVGDFEIRNRAAAGAVAFVSATFVLVAADGATLWEVEEARLPIPLATPDVTRPELARIAREAVNRAFASFPLATRRSP